MPRKQVCYRTQLSAQHTPGRLTQRGEEGAESSLRGSSGRFDIGARYCQIYRTPRIEWYRTLVYKYATLLITGLAHAPVIGSPSVTSERRSRHNLPPLRTASESTVMADPAAEKPSGGNRLYKQASERQVRTLRCAPVGVSGNQRFSQERLLKQSQQLDSECTFSPVINKQRKSKTVSTDSSPASERLFAASAVRAKRLAEAAESAAQQHTFKPTISKRSMQMKREPGSKTHEILYAKVRCCLSVCRFGLASNFRPQAATKAAEKEVIRKQREMEGCTFKPQLSKRAKALKYVTSDMLLVLIGTLP